MAPTAKSPSLSSTRCLICPVCNDDFSSVKRLANHIMRHVKGPAYRCPWPSCGRKFTSRVRFNVHQRIHDRTTFKCQRCPMKFPYIAALTKHEKNHVGRARKSDHTLNRQAPYDSVRASGVPSFASASTAANVTFNCPPRTAPADPSHDQPGSPVSESMPLSGSASSDDELDGESSTQKFRAIVAEIGQKRAQGAIQTNLQSFVSALSDINGWEDADTHSHTSSLPSISYTQPEVENPDFFSWPKEEEKPIDLSDVFPDFIQGPSQPFNSFLDVQPNPHAQDDYTQNLAKEGIEQFEELFRQFDAGSTSTELWDAFMQSITPASSIMIELTDPANSRSPANDAFPVAQDPSPTSFEGPGPLESRCSSSIRHK